VLTRNLEGTSNENEQRDARGRGRGTNLEELGVERRDSPSQLADGDSVNVDRGGKVDSVITGPL